ncbi:MAG: tyrosine--tRNA ligase [Proteobacteria bacterium]|nr:tyrosine--tRNA ligase [Pseudomonadota bacterium]MDA1058164.1 tyrosine--tRNA ligase [Pseudomonadota bacterium]
MPTAKSDFLRAMIRRGDFHDATDFAALDEAAVSGSVVGYIGFDATAPSLHVGNLMQILKLRIMQRNGQKPIALVGGGTTKIGDPSGKDEMRQIRGADEIDANVERIKGLLSRFLTFGDGPTDAILVNNADWLERLEYIPFLREIGSHFTINRMLTFESVKARLERESPLSFIEFNYMILQAYDYLELNRRFGCLLQMGGSDQWGNILNGVELCRRVDGKTVFGMTSDLLTTASGAKMGKTAQGAVWLSEDMLSPYDYWQFWRNTEDADVGRFLRLFTDLADDEIIRLEALDGAEINDAKKILATEATAMCHGRVAADAAAETAMKTFEQGRTGAALPTIEVPRAELEAGIPAFDLLRRSGLASSGGEARRLIKGGGARVNDTVIVEDVQAITLADVGSDGTIKLSAGKKRHALIRAA